MAVQTSTRSWLIFDRQLWKVAEKMMIQRCDHHETSHRVSKESVGRRVTGLTRGFANNQNPERTGWEMSRNWPEGRVSTESCIGQRAGPEGEMG